MADFNQNSPKVCWCTTNIGLFLDTGNVFGCFFYNHDTACILSTQKVKSLLILTKTSLENRSQYKSPLLLEKFLRSVGTLCVALRDARNSLINYAIAVSLFRQLRI